MMQERRQSQGELWQEVWHEYDSRKQAPLAKATPVIRPERRRRPRGRAVRAMFACCIIVSTTAYAVAPLMAAARLGQALAAGDTAWLNEAVDWAEISPTLSDTMLAQTTGHDGQAAAYLRGMAQDVARGISTPGGITGLLRDRLPRGSAGRDMIGSFRPIDATRWEVALHAPGERDQALSITLSLRDPLRMRWQVTGMTVADRARDLGG